MATIFSPTPGISLLRNARKVRDGIPEADAVPMSIYDNIAFGVRLFEAVSCRYGRARAVGVDQSRIMERKQR